MKRKASLNHSFRTVWSDAQQAFVVVAENIKTKGKKSSSQQSINISASVLTALSLTISGIAFADPSGGNVTSGSATINQSGDTTTISQTSQNVNINWDSFNIDSHETVNFDQPNASALAVNNILDSNASQILGKLNANGQVWLINPNGIFFGQNAVVDVGSILASTLKPKNGETTNGNQIFNRPGSGAIANQGEITAKNGGYVALISRSVVNDGSITAKNGAVALGAGDKVTVKFANNALVGLNVNKNDVLALVDNQDIIKANGGMVLMSAGAKDSLIASVVNNSGKVQARTVQHKDGKIILKGGMQTGTTNVAGTLDVRALNGGDAGFVETSAAIVNINVDTKVKLDSTSGKNGKWQIDPVEFTVGTTPSDHASGHALETALNTGSLEIITSGATGGAGSSGDITVNDSLEWSGNNNLTFKAQNDVVLNQQVKASGNAKIKMEAGQAIALNDSVETNANGNAIVLAGQQFTNTAGSGALQANNGRWQVWSNDPNNDTKNGLAYDFKQYNATYQSTTVLGSGNGFLYQVQPNVTVELIGKVNKTYDGTTDATLTSNHFQVNGAIDGDVVTVNHPLTGQYTTKGTSNKVKNVGKDKTVEASGISIASASNGNATVYGYGLTSATSSGVVGKITKKNIVVDAQAQDKIYDGTKAATAVLSSSGVIAGDDVSFSADASFRNKRAKDNKKVDIENITATGSDKRNYTFNTEAEDRANITRKALDISIDAQDKVYDGNTDATVSNLQVSGVIAGDKVFINETTAAFEDKNVGQGKEVNVGIEGAGKDIDNYAFKSEIETNADITPKAVTVQAVAYNKIYDGNRKAQADLSAAGIISGDDISFDGKARFGNKNAKLNKKVTVKDIVASGADAANYSFNDTAESRATIARRALDLEADVADKVYDGNKTAIVQSLTSAGIISGDDISFTHSSAEFDDKNVGNNKKVSIDGISSTGVDAKNYAHLSAIETEADITPKAVTVQAVAYDKIYDGNRKAQADLNAAGIISGDDISFDGKARFGNKHAKLNKKVTVRNIVANGVDAGNYSFNDTAETRATIARLALDLEAVAKDKVYDGTKDATLESLTSAGIISGDDITFNHSSAEFEDKNAGTDKKVEVEGIIASGSDAHNYAFKDSAITWADIEQKAIMVDALAQDKVYDGVDDATADLVISGLVSGDDVSFAFVEANFDNKNVGQNKLVTVSGINASGQDAGNYHYSNTAQTNADITPKQIVLRAYAADKVYDGTADAWLGTNAYGHPHFEHDGMVAGDNFWFSFSKAKGQFTDKNVGQGKQVVFTGVTANGADKGNYSFDIQNVYSTADITPKHITLRAYAADKVYDGTADAWLGTNAYGHPHFEHDGMVAGDNFWFSFSKAKGQFTDKNAGQGKQVVFTGVTANGADKGNYSFDIQKVYSTANITPKNVALTVYAQDKVYDDNAHATLDGYETQGVIDGDQAWVSYDNAYGLFDNKQVGTNKTVTFTGMKMVGADEGNYTFEPTVFTSADIIKRQGYRSEFLRNFKQYINAYLPEVSAIILNEPKKMAYPLPLTQEEEK